MINLLRNAAKVLFTKIMTELMKHLTGKSWH
uniref:Uncharacterized protein n=1 Tax=Anguilla anguilla TaxID=7936 RepID=A0A0E9SKR3_ANGAN